MSGQYLSTAEAADYLRYSVRSIKRFVHDGLLTPVNTRGHWRFTRLSLDEFLIQRASHKTKRAGNSVPVPYVDGLNPLLKEALSK